MDWKLVLQIAGVVLGLLYLWLEYRADIRLWIVGLIMPLVHGALYYKAGLYADCSMQAYYVLAGLYGWIVWHNAPRRKAAADRIGHTPLRQAAGLIAIYAAAHTGIYFLLVGFTNSTVPFWDAMTTAGSIVAMWMLSRKYVEQWLVWLAVDLVTVGQACTPSTRRWQSRVIFAGKQKCAHSNPASKRRKAVPCCGDGLRFPSIRAAVPDAYFTSVR